MKKLTLLAAGALTLLGLGCLNYTSFEGHDHHVEFAKEKGLPEPSSTIRYAGMAMVVAGSMTLGCLLKSRQS